MTLFDLFFLVSVLFVFSMAAGIAVSAIRGRWKTAGRLSRFLALFVALYAAVGMCVALARPRRFYAPGERRCFDDWCVAAVGIESAIDSAESPCRADIGPGRTWVATIEVSSVARRIHQRARDAEAELEDGRGIRYRPCAAPAGNSLSDILGPGESFRVRLPFRLPPAATPAGLIMHHGDFPGVVIIGEDNSFLHQPALHRLAVNRRP
jgi:hypothetical protein